MPSGKHKSRTMRRVHVKTPGNRNIVQYKKREPSKRNAVNVVQSFQALLAKDRLKCKICQKVKKGQKDHMVEIFAVNVQE